jgi:hypothetical protein
VLHSTVFEKNVENMSAHKFNHHGVDYVIETAQLPNGKWIARIDPLGGGGDWIRQNPQQKTDTTGKTTSKPGLLAVVQKQLPLFG